MKKILLILVLAALGSCCCTDKCKECTDIKAPTPSQNANLSIKSITTKDPTPEGFTIRTEVHYENDDCAAKPKLIVLLPANSEGEKDSLQILEPFNPFLTSSPSISCSFTRNGTVECNLGDVICPPATDMWVEIKVRSKIKNISAFVYSQTPDAIQCDNFKHISEK